MIWPHFLFPIVLALWYPSYDHLITYILSSFLFWIIRWWVGYLVVLLFSYTNSTEVFMEIDLNYAVTEVEKNAYCNGDCGKGGCVCCLSSSTSSCSSNSSAAPVSSSIYLELWHACAGPLTSLPKRGNVVVYFPQGHLEQAASSSAFSPMEMPTFDLQPQIFCRVVNILLLVSSEFLFLDWVVCFLQFSSHTISSSRVFWFRCDVYSLIKQANKENDEVYTQVTLLPQPEVWFLVDIIAAWF